MPHPRVISGSLSSARRDYRAAEKPSVRYFVRFALARCRSHHRPQAEVPSLEKEFSAAC